MRDALVTRRSPMAVYPLYQCPSRPAAADTGRPFRPVRSCGRPCAHARGAPCSLGTRHRGTPAYQCCGKSALMFKRGGRLRVRVCRVQQGRRLCSKREHKRQFLASDRHERETHKPRTRTRIRVRARFPRTANTTKTKLTSYVTRGYGVRCRTPCCSGGSRRQS